MLSHRHNNVFTATHSAPAFAARFTVTVGWVDRDRVDNNRQ